MKHTIYEDPVTRKFALVRVPRVFADGDKLPIPAATRWLDTREEAVSALTGLFDEDEDAASS